MLEVMPLKLGVDYVKRNLTKWKTMWKVQTAQRAAFSHAAQSL